MIKIRKGEKKGSARYSADHRCRHLFLGRDGRSGLQIDKEGDRGRGRTDHRRRSGPSSFSRAQ